MLEPGKLDQRVLLKRRDAAVSSSGSGAVLEEFLLPVKAWARVEPLTGTEGFAGSQRFAQSSHRFQIRFHDGLDSTWRIEWRGQDYDVTEVIPGGQRLREWQDVLATASPAENPVA